MHNYANPQYKLTQEDIVLATKPVQTKRVLFSNKIIVESEEGHDFSEKIPINILSIICEYLPVKSIVNLLQTNKILNKSNKIINMN